MPLMYNKASVPAEFTDLLEIGKETHCRYAWSKRIKKSAWQAIGRRQSGKPVTTLLDFKLKSEGYIDVLGKNYCSVDVFLSPNQFFDWRNTKQLAQFHANWLEIDTKDHSILTLEEQDELIAEVLNAITALNLPAPTAYVASGSGGVHLYWIYQGVEAFKWRLRVWREITYVIAKKMKSLQPHNSRWKVDFSASRDPSRVMRLPGTFHGGSGRVATAFVGGPTYNFDSFARMVVTSQQNLNALKAFGSGKLIDIPRKPNPVMPAVAVKVDISKNQKHNIKNWWFRIYTEIVSHARKNKITEGKRDLYAFILFVAMQHIKDSTDEALAAIKQINKELIHLPDDELNAYIKTAIATRYKYRKETVAEYLEMNLGIPSDFLYPQVKKLTPPEIKAAQHRAAIKTANIKKSKTLLRLIDALNHLKSNSVQPTKESIALQAGVSTKTVSRYWKEIINNSGTLGGLLYIPPKGSHVERNSARPEKLAPPLPNITVGSGTGGSAAKENEFTALCNTMVQMGVVAKSEGVTWELFDFKSRGRLARVILSAHLPWCISELLATTIVTLACEKPYRDMSTDHWCAYAVVAGKNYHKSCKGNVDKIMIEFKKFLDGECFTLSDKDLSLIASQVVSDGRTQ